MFKNFKRKLVSVMGVSLAASVALTGIAASQSPDAALDLPGQGWYTGVQLQNVGTGTARVTIQSYQTGTADDPVLSQKDIPQNGSRTYLPQDLALPSGFQGSAVVSSDQPLFAIVNVTNRPAGGNGIVGGMAAAQYQGINTPANELRFPMAKRNYYNKSTTFYIQNAGTSPTTVTATFRTPAGTYPYTSPTIPAGRMVIITPAMAGMSEGNTNGLGSLTVVSNNGEVLAGVVSEHGSENPAQILQSTRAFTASDGDTRLFAPTIKNGFFNRFTGLQVQNISGGSINITVTYRGAEGTCVGQTFTDTATGVASGTSKTFNHLPGQTNLPTGCLASATVEATGGNVVAVVNESFVASFLQGGGNGGRQESTTYSAFAASSATNTASAPLYKENSFDKGTGLNVQNVGSVPTNIVATFVNAAGTTYTTVAKTVQPGASYQFVNLRTKPSEFSGTPMPSDLSNQAGVFGVTITSTAAPIVAIANESTYPFNNSPLQQDKNNYEAFSR